MKKTGNHALPAALITHLTLRHGRGKVTLSSSAYKYQRRNQQAGGAKILEKERRQWQRGKQDERREKGIENRGQIEERKNRKREGTKQKQGGFSGSQQLLLSLHSGLRPPPSSIAIPPPPPPQQLHFEPPKATATIPAGRRKNRGRENEKQRKKTAQRSRGEKKKDRRLSHRLPPLLPFTPARPPPSQVSLPSLFFFFFFVFFFFFPAVHCMNSGRELIRAFCSCSSGLQPRSFFFGPGQAQFQKLSKKYFKTNLWFPRVFFTKFCLILDLYFYDIKIQIQY